MIAKLGFFSEDNQQIFFCSLSKCPISAKGVGFRLRKTDGTLNQQFKKHQHQP
jgi:hypothetical protein